MNRIEKTLLIAVCVSLASQVKFDFITEGFVIAMSVTVMAIFIYCYEDLSAVYVILCSGFCSPLLRLLLELSKGSAFSDTLLLVLPDVSFFLTFALWYTVIYRYIIKKPRDIRNFPYVIFVCDFLSNLMELAVRGVIQGINLIDAQDVTWILFIALCRTILTQTILLALETYSSLLLRQEHDREYRRLLVQASIFESELYVMEKNAAEIEDIMKTAFGLHQEMKEMPVPADVKRKGLYIAKTAHEVKGDYLNIISVLKGVFISDVDRGTMRMSDLMKVEKANVQSLLKDRGIDVDMTLRMKTDFHVKNYFKMMSVIRNLLMNAAEAGAGKIQAVLDVEGGDFVLTVKDNGKGISPDSLGTIFLEGFSTKFNEKTGDMQRGMGLSLVKEYVEIFFKGSISVSSVPGQGTEFVIRIPGEVFGEDLV